MRAAVGLAVTALALCGCASGRVSIRTLPDQTPAADAAAAVSRAAALGAARQAFERAASQEAAQGVVPLSAADAPSMYTYDPWERLNRAIYRFNARFDEALFLPVADTYRRLPSPLRTGVHNFFGNLAEPCNAVNYLLQWHPLLGLRSVGRFAINSTVGIGGLLDVAAKARLTGALTGFSATLSTWGMHPGPYLVIPLLGPATVRDGIGLAADYTVAYVIDIAGLDRGYQSYLLGTLAAIDQRANIDFRYYGSGSPFEYETIRFLYVHRELIEDAARHARSPPRAQPETPAGR